MKSTLLILLLFIAAFASAQESRIALVIGNANYEKGKLKNPVNDALLMQNTFQNLGFDVILDTNITTRDHFYKTISTFLDKRMKYDVAFIYYAGHAVQIGGDNYMLATKEAYNSERDAKNLGININAFIEDYQDPVANKINVLIIDACRNNPFEQSWTPQNRSLENGLGLAEMKNLPTGTIIAYSTQPGYTASDGKDKNSLYCLSLAQNFMLEGVRIEDVFVKVKKEVRIASSEKQKPTYTNDLEGTAFYLKKTDLTNHIIEIDSLIDDGQNLSLIIAREKISALLALHPNDKRCLLRKGRLELYNEEIEYDGSDLFKADKLFPNDSEVKQFLARYYRSKKEFEKALKEINSSISQDADNPESYNWKIRILLESGDTTNALECYSKIIEIEKNNPKRYEYRATYFIEKGDFDNALTDLNKAIELAPTEAYFYNIRANFFIQRGDYPSALKDLDKAIELSPTSYYYNNRGDLYQDNIKSSISAIKDFEKAFQLANEDVYQRARSLNNSALIFFEREDYAQAIERYSKAIELYPNEFYQYSNRADAYRMFEKYDLALKDYNKAIELDKNNPAERYDDRANFFIQQKDYTSALKDLDNAIELAQEKGFYLNNRGDFYNEYLNNNDKAIEDFKKAFQLSSLVFEKSRSLNNMALIYFGQEKYDLAIEAYSKAIEISPNLRHPYSNRADVFMATQQFNLALADYSKAIDLDIEIPEERYNDRANFFIQQEDYSSALKDLDKAIELAREKGSYFNNRGDFYRDYLNNNDKAIDDFKKAFQLSSVAFQKSRSLNNSALIYFDQEKYDLAIESYSKAIDLTPDIADPYSNRADAYMKTEQYESAFRDYTKAIEIERENLEYSYNKRADYFILLEDYTNALKDLDKAIELAEYKGEYYNNRADFYKNSINNFEKAIEDYKIAFQLTEDPFQKARSLNNLALIYFEQEKYDLAIESYSEAIRLTPDIWNPYSNRADVYMKTGQLEYAFQDYTKAIEIDKETPEDRYYTRANYYIQQLDYTEALKDINMAVELSPTAYYYNNRADFNKDFGNNYEKAIEDYSIALKISNDIYQKTRALNNRALVYIENEKFNLAINELSEAISLDPKSAFQFSNRADAYCNVKNYKAALDDYSKAIELDNSNPSHYIARGEFYNTKLRKPNEALVDFSLAIALDSSYSSSWWRRGLLLTNEFNDHRSAIADFNHIIELDSNNVGAMNWVGVFYSRMLDEDKAIKYYNEVIAKVGTTFSDSAYSYGSIAWAYNNLGEIYKLKKDKSLAISYYENAVKYDDLNPEQYDNRAWFLAMYLKDYTEALKNINKSIELDKENPKWQLNKAKILLRSNDISDAENSFKMAVEKSKKSHLYISELANFYSVIGEYSKADKLFDLAFKADSITASIYHQRTEHLMRQSKMTEAMNLANESQMKFKNDTVSFEQLGRIFMSKKDYLKSLKAYEHALAIMEFNEGDRNFDDAILEVYSSDICLALHEIYTILNESELACSMLAKAEVFLKTETRPDNLELEEKINSLKQKCTD